jgi:hypothetical protein
MRVEDTNLGFKRVVIDAVIDCDELLFDTTESLDSALLVRVEELFVLAVGLRRGTIETVVWGFEVGSRMVLEEIRFRS